MATIADRRRGFEQLTVPAMLWVIVCLLRIVLFALLPAHHGKTSVRVAYIDMFDSELDSFTWQGSAEEPPDET